MGRKRPDGSARIRGKVNLNLGAVERVVWTHVPVQNPVPLVTVRLPATSPVPIPKGSIVRVIQAATATDADVRRLQKSAEGAARVDVQPRPRADDVPLTPAQQIARKSPTARDAVLALVDLHGGNREDLKKLLEEIMQEVGL